MAYKQGMYSSPYLGQGYTSPYQDALSRGIKKRRNPYQFTYPENPYDPERPERSTPTEDQQVGTPTSPSTYPPGFRAPYWADPEMQNPNPINPLQSVVAPYTGRQAGGIENVDKTLPYLGAARQDPATWYPQGSPNQLGLQRQGNPFDMNVLLELLKQVGMVR